MTPTEYLAITKQTGLYPGGGTGSEQAINYCMLGLGEFGEAQGKWKKNLRGDKSFDEIKPALIDELGDGLWYLVRSLDELGLTIEELMDLNATKVLDRKARNVTRGDGDHR